MSVERLSTGAELRVTGGRDGVVVLCINGGVAKDAPGTWSASIEYLVRRLAPNFPDLGWAELKYRIRSWKRMGMGIADGQAALDAVVAAGADEVVLVGFSMGGAVSSAIAAHPAVRRVIGLAPWLPEQLDLAPMRGRHMDVLHGNLDGERFGFPGVSAAEARAGLDRIIALGGSGSFRMIRGATHGIALRAPGGRIAPLPRAGAWVDGVRALLASHPG